MSFKIRLREYSPTGVRGKIIPAQNIQLAEQLNGSSTLQFDVATSLTGSLVAPFVVGVEWAVGNKKFALLSRNQFFVVAEDANDDRDLSKTFKYTGEAYIPWLMGKALLHWSTTSKNNEREYADPGPGGVAVSAGYILNGMIVEAKSRGWGSQFTYDFNKSNDSAGTAWLANDKAITRWAHLTPLSRVLDQLANTGMCDWTVEGLKLRIFRPDQLKRDRTELVLGGPRLERVPIKSDVSGLFTNLTVVPEKAKNWLYLNNTGADNRFGRLEAAQTQSGVSSHAEATKLAQPALIAGRKALREESFEWSPDDVDILPWRDFIIGDHVTVRSRGARLERRVIGLVVIGSEDKTTVRVVVGEKIGSKSKKAADRLRAITAGGLIGGTGAVFPASTGPVLREPLPPAGLVVTANTAEWAEDWKAVSSVSFAWSEVNEAVDGSIAEPVTYEIWSRTPSGKKQRDVAVSVPDLEATVTGWEPGGLRLVSVRVKADNGLWSVFSGEVSVTPAVPLSLVPKAPTGLVVVSNVARFSDAGPVADIKVSWAAVTKSVDDETITVAEYEVWIDGHSFARIAGLSVSFSAPFGLTREVSVRALSEHNIFGDPSATLSVTAATPELVSRAPSTPVLVSDMGIISASWDGAYIPASPLDSAHTVGIERKVGSGWVEVGSRLDRAGSWVLKADVGTVVEVRLTAFDRLGRLTGSSSSASVTVQGVKVPDLDISVSQVLDTAAQDAADAKAAAGAAVKSIVEEWAQGSSATVAPTSGWSSTPPAWVAGQYIWARSVVTFGDNSTSVSDPVVVTGNPGADGAPGAPGTPGNDGRSVSSVDVWYYLSNSSTSLTGGTWQTTAPAWVDGKFMWSKTVTTYSSGSPSESTPVCITGAKGSTGSAGKGISSTVITYQGHTDGTTAPTGTWGSTIPTVAAGNYLWTRTVITYTDSSTSTAYTVARMGTNGSPGTPGTPGAPGADGRGVTSIVEEYYLSTSATTQTGGSWVLTPPAWVDGRFYWIRSKITYTDASVVTTTPVNVTGAKGSTGSAGDPGKDGATIWTTTIAPVTPNYTFTTSNLVGPSGLTPKAGDIVLYSYYRYTVTTVGASTILTGSRVSIRGAAGASGTNGADGSDGVSVTSTKRYYQLGTSAPAKPTVYPAPSPWVETEPAYVAGQSLYYTDLTVLSNSTFVYTPVSKAATYEIAAEALTTANGKNKAYDSTSNATGSATQAGDIWRKWDKLTAGRKLLASWTWNGSAWIADSLDPTYIPVIDIGTGTAGELSGQRLAFESVTADILDMDEGYFNKMFGNELMAGRVLVNHVEPAFGELLSITANEAIELLVGKQEQVDEDIDNLGARVDGTENSIDDLASDIVTVNSNLNIIDGKAILAEEKAEQALTDVQEVSSVVRILPDGIHVGKEDWSEVTVITHEGMELRQGGDAYAEFKQGRAIVADLRTNKVRLQNHVIETAGNGTIIRRV